MVVKRNLILNKEKNYIIKIQAKSRVYYVLVQIKAIKISVHFGFFLLIQPIMAFFHLHRSDY